MSLSTDNLTLQELNFISRIFKDNIFPITNRIFRSFALLKRSSHIVRPFVVSPSRHNGRRSSLEKDQHFIRGLQQINNRLTRMNRDLDDASSKCSQSQNFEQWNLIFGSNEYLQQYNIIFSD
jgi:hypothetical protein